MPISTDSEYDLLGDDCPLYFGADNTPKYVYAGFTGIKVGAHHKEDFFPPANATYILTQSTPTIWESVFDTITIRFTIGADHMYLWQYSTIDGYRFYGFLEDFPQFYWHSLLAPDNNWIYGDGFVTTLTPRANPPASIQGVMNLFNIPPHKKTFVSIEPQDDNKIINLYSRTADSTRLRIKYDPDQF